MNSTALALQQPALAPYTPRDIGEAMALAKTYAASKILGAYGTADQVMLVMATGAELGIPATAALRGLYVVEGRVFMSSDLMVALCLRAPQCERFDLSEQSDTAAAYTVQRKGGQPLTFRFGVEDARRAGLGGAKDGGAFKAESNWSKYPGTMCRHRAAAIAARALFPDVIMGLYDEGEQEEAGTTRQVGPTVTPLPTATRTAAPIVEADVVGGESDERRIVAALEAATAKADVDELANEALRVWPKVRPESVKQAHLAAKARTKAAPAANPAPAAPPTLPFDEKTGEVTDRQPGEEG